MRAAEEAVDMEWLIGAGPVPTEGAPCKLTCNTEDFEVTRVMSTAPVVVKPEAVVPARDPIAKYEPVRIRRELTDDDPMMEHATSETNPRGNSCSA
jgi:hypothetical protein